MGCSIVLLVCNFFFFQMWEDEDFERVHSTCNCTTGCLYDATPTLQLHHSKPYHTLWLADFKY
jgi:hypothetical protein